LKKWFGIALLAAYMGSATGFHELLKLPALAGHYFDHRGNEGLPGLMEFLALHYAHDAGHDQDHDHQGKLPFKSNGVSCPATAIALIPIDGELLPIPSAGPQTNLIAADLSSCSGGYHGTVWQPPQS
jgi:hypothetical protein